MAKDGGVLRIPVELETKDFVAQIKNIEYKLRDLQETLILAKNDKEGLFKKQFKGRGNLRHNTFCI